MTSKVSDVEARRQSMCNCHSYNRETGATPERQMDWAPYFPAMALNAEYTVVNVDACIADEVEALWKKGVYTIGSCCGHGNDEQRCVIVEHGLAADLARCVVSARTKVLWWHLGEHLGAARASQQPSAQWIACSERMPERWTEVFVWPFPNDTVSTAQMMFTKENTQLRWMYATDVPHHGVEWYDCNPTHWQPISPPDTERTE